MKLAILCSGQAGQRRDMMDALFAAPESRTVLAAASELLQQDFVTWWRGLSEADLYRNVPAQFAIAVYQLAAWRRIAAYLPPPVVVAGYSVGELPAYFVAGALDEYTTLRLIRERAALMDEVAGSGEEGGSCMLLWRGRTSPRAAALRQQAMRDCNVHVAIRRREGEEVLAGRAQAMRRFIATPGIAHPDSVVLPVSVPSHTPELAAAAERFRLVLEGSSLAVPQTVVLAGIDGSPVRSREQAIAALSSQIARTVRWDLCVDALAERGVDVALELGPGNDLAKLLEASQAAIPARSIEEFASLDAVAVWTRHHQR